MFSWMRGKDKSEDRVNELLKENEELKVENGKLKFELEILRKNSYIAVNEIRSDNPALASNESSNVVEEANKRPAAYDDNYVDTVSVISAAKTAGLNMYAVQEGLDEAGRDWDKLFAWSEFVYNEIRKSNPNYVDYTALRKRLITLDSWTNELADSLDNARNNNTLKAWEVTALAALEVAKKVNKERYS